MRNCLPAVVLALLLAGPAAAEVLKVSPIIKDMRSHCVTEAKAAGVGKAGRFCSCVGKSLREWVEESDGVERQTRLWSLKRETLPESVPDSEVYIRAAEAGVDETDLKSLIIVNFYALDEHFEKCADKAG